MADKKMDYQKWENLKGQTQIPLAGCQTTNPEPTLENLSVWDNGQENLLSVPIVSTPELYKLKQSLKRWAWWVRLSCCFMVFFSMLDFIVLLKNHVWGDSSWDAMQFSRLGLIFVGFVTAWLGIRASKHKNKADSKWYLRCLWVVTMTAIVSLIVSWSLYEPKKLAYENRAMKKIEGKIRENVLTVESAEFRTDNGLENNPSDVELALEDFSEYVGDVEQLVSDPEKRMGNSVVPIGSKNNKANQAEESFEKAQNEWNYFDYDDWATDSSILSEKWYRGSKQKLVKGKSSPILSLFNYKLFKQNHRAAAAFSILFASIVSAVFVFFAYKLHNGIKRNEYILVHAVPQENLNYL